MIEDKIQSWLIDEIVEVARESTSDGFNEHNATREAEILVEKLVKKLNIPVVVGSCRKSGKKHKYKTSTICDPCLLDGIC